MKKYGIIGIIVLIVAAYCVVPTVHALDAGQPEGSQEQRSDTSLLIVFVEASDPSLPGGPGNPGEPGVTPVPEPTTVALMAVGVVLVIGLRARKRHLDRA